MSYINRHQFLSEAQGYDNALVLQPLGRGDSGYFIVFPGAVLKMFVAVRELELINYNGLISKIMD